MSLEWSEDKDTLFCSFASCHFCAVFWLVTGTGGKSLWYYSFVFGNHRKKHLLLITFHIYKYIFNILQCYFFSLVFTRVFLIGKCKGCRDNAFCSRGFLTCDFLNDCISKFTAHTFILYYISGVLCCFTKLFIISVLFVFVPCVVELWQGEMSAKSSSLLPLVSRYSCCWLGVRGHERSRPETPALYSVCVIITTYTLWW